MKKHLLLFALSLFLIGPCLHASQVTVAGAQQVALNFFNLKMQAAPSRYAPVASLIYTKTDVDNNVVFYVFDMSPAKGFVIVAADDNVRPILAYSTENNFRTDFQKIGLNHWVYETSANIRMALQHHVQANAHIANQWSAYRQGLNPVTEKSASVAPLVTTTWDQESEGNPPPYIYNLFCPWNSSDQQRCLTGCVATAQAQIMKFWNYPAYGIDSFSYDDVTPFYSYDYGVQSTNFSAHIYQWDSMPSALNMANTATALGKDTAVDVLMYDCAVSVAMDFGDDNQDGSGANALLAEELPYDSFCTQYALVKYFSYNPDTIAGYFRDHGYTDASWIALIEHDLNIGRPVIYEGDDSVNNGGGHCWVCDGYDADTMLHMNWGWSGYSDGYFSVSNLTTPGPFNPIQDDDVLVGIIPLYTAPPVAGFTASFAGTCNQAVQFTDTSQGNVKRWTWNFGDGTTSNQQNPIHTYADTGTYTVTLTVGNPAGFSTKTITDVVTVTCVATGIASAGEAISFNMFPNPATNDVVLQTTVTGADAAWSIKNILGQTLISKFVESNQTHINLSNLANGVYLVELTAGEKTAIKKLVINK